MRDVDGSPVDLVERLLDEAQYSVSLSALGKTKRSEGKVVLVDAQSYEDYNQFRANLCTEAADEIKRLRRACGEA